MKRNIVVYLNTVFMVLLKEINLRMLQNGQLLLELLKIHQIFKQIMIMLVIEHLVYLLIKVNGFIVHMIMQILKQLTMILVQV